MNVKEALAGSGLPLADAEILLATMLKQDRTWLLAHPEVKLSSKAWSQFHEWAERRRMHEPVAYITNEQKFFGRPFFVDWRVFIPRPATEGVVRGALRFLENPGDFREEVDEGIIVNAKSFPSRGWNRVHTIVDIGTGSGCIAVTLAFERPELTIIATDTSSDALDIARMNAERHQVLDRLEFREGDGMEIVNDLREPFLMVSNPPYIPNGRNLMKDVQDYEPHVALFGETVARQLREAAEAHPFCAGYVMECGRDQW